VGRSQINLALYKSFNTLCKTAPLYSDASPNLRIPWVQSCALFDIQVGLTYGGPIIRGGMRDGGGEARRPKQFLTYQSRQPNEVIMLY
jgi:hypothetical protein